MNEYKGTMRTKVIVDERSITYMNMSNTRNFSFSDIADVTLESAILISPGKLTIKMNSGILPLEIFFNKKNQESFEELYELLKNKSPRIRASEETVSKNKQSYSDFSPTRTLGDLVSIDDNNNQWHVKPDRPGEVPTIYSTLGITKVWSDSYYSKNIISKSSQKKGIGRAAAGYVLAGPVGAVVGSTTGKTTHENETIVDQSGVVHWLQKDTSGPEKSYSIDMKTQSGALALENILKTFIEESPAPAASADTDPAEELRKYKSLLDDGIITTEDFEQKKKQLLNL